MNTPNKLTLLRVILIPFFVVCMLAVNAGWGKWAALAIFIIASLTDTLDGYLARRDNLVTNFGKFMDPLADKLLVCSAMICLVDMERIPSWVVIIIIGREFVISGFRLIASDNGVVIAANYWGKIKTVCQMIMIIVVIANLGGVFDVVEQVLIYLSLILTVIALATYLWDNRKVLSMQD
ncbi:CDP-diacylglycerol--glycerol-3-phosphate 3-phosphatidyltransferase [bacterium]|nr:CDP-diacylglycerol--glycerol-3-phosphate 3-phosphatidyltransferase [bacterium]MDY3023441.1 CDP-diacylglycerol--glycerol-3-phosphate 3-phosphatidyltransferase [Oliverpabstia sp.]